MSITISSPSAGTATTIYPEQPVRAPLARDIPWTAPNAPAVGSIPLGYGAQVVPVSLARQEFAGGVNHGSNPRAGKDI